MRYLTFRGARGMMALAFAAVLTTACNPCAGVVSSCENAPRVGIQGRIVDVYDGHGIPNANISLIRISDDRRDSIATETDGEGNYQIEMRGESGMFDVVVAASGEAPYRVQDVRLESSNRTGDARVLGIWVAQPVFGLAVEFVSRTTGAVVSSGSVSFKRTGGVTMAGARITNDTYSASFSGGRISMLEGVRAGGVGDVIGDLTVKPSGATATVLRDVHFPANYEFRPQRWMRLTTEPGLSYVVSLYNRGTVTPAVGTKVTFRRTGGLAISPESVTVTTGTNGQALLALGTTSSGVVTGDLIIQPPAPFHEYTKTGIELSTFNEPGVRYLPSMGVGPHLPWLGVLNCDGRRVAGARVRAVRVGGIAVTPDSITSTSNENGEFRLIFAPADYGDLIVDIDVAVPNGTGCIGFVEHDLHLPTIDFDSDARFIREWSLPNR